MTALWHCEGAAGASICPDLAYLETIAGPKRRGEGVEAPLCLDIPEQGPANELAYSAIASSPVAAATATAEETLATKGSSAAQAQLQASLTQSYNDLVTAAGQLGITGDAADTMARKALGIPKEIPIKTWVNDTASGKLDSIKGKADALDGKVSTVTIVERTIKRIETQVVGGGSADDPSMTALRPGSLAKKAVGGAISGPGTGTSDQVPIMASNGEHMLTAREVQMMGGHQGVYRFRQSVREGTVQYRAAGGPIGAPSYQLAARSPAVAPRSDGDMQMTGTLVLDSGEVLGVFRGIAQQEAQQGAQAAISAADAQSRFRRTGRTG